MGLMSTSDRSRGAAEAASGRCARRIGAVSYLNSKPLIWSLPELARGSRVLVDLPARLADTLEAGHLDVALVPSVEYLRHADWKVVSDACVACNGPVRSVKLYCRVPLARIRTLALDEGSRTSAALTRILLREQYGLNPKIRRLPVGVGAEACDADAVMLIGDRAMQASDNGFAPVVDLGEEWTRWTGLPMVFAMWIAREGVDCQPLSRVLSEARDRGVARLEEIARAEARGLGVAEADCLAYLRDHLCYRMGRRERRGLSVFYELAAQHGLAPKGLRLAFDDAGPR